MGIMTSSNTQQPGSIVLQPGREVATLVQSCSSEIKQVHQHPGTPCQSGTQQIGNVVTWRICLLVGMSVYLHDSSFIVHV